MNIYSKLLQTIKTIAEQDDSVNTVTNNGRIDLDINKTDLFPIVDVFVTGATFPSDAVIRLTIELVCVDLRDTNNEVTSDKFWNQDNEVDNLGETLMVINRIWKKLYKDFEDTNVTASESPALVPIEGDGKDVYDGWSITFDVDVPSVEMSLCDD